jgi:hypothetical protein
MAESVLALAGPKDVQSDSETVLGIGGPWRGS